MKKSTKTILILTSVLTIFIAIMLIIFLKQPQPLQKSATDFYVGGDLSSIIEVEENGGVFYDYEGNEKDVFKILKENGMDSIRVWNDPVDENGSAYANGHNDLETAIQIGKRATACDMRVLIDFHYSDYWADPSSQKCPKNWKNLTFPEKEKALYDYTKTSLCKLLDAGVNITMVQIGNETTSGLSGETEWDKMTSLMSVGSKAVRETAEQYNREILVAMHFTEYEHYDWYASKLQQFEVDYDVFASSYYSYWHGDLAGLEKSLHFLNYPYTVNKDGQTQAICDIYKTATALGDDCLGLFYWEPAWISIPGSDYVGSPWENQALFDSSGKPLPALRSFLFSENH